MKKVLVSAPYMLRDSEISKVKPLLNELDIDYTLADVEERLEEEDLLKIIDQYHGVICGDDRFTRKVYEAAKKLEVVVKWGTGIDSLNEEVAKELGIKLFRTPGAFTQPVSDTTVAMILSFVRNLGKNDSIIKNGGWDKPQGYCLSEKTVGLIGFGDIGRTVSKKLASFNCKIKAFDPIVNEKSIYNELGVEKVSLEEIITSCDFISLHCDLNESSHHILDNNAFNSMKQKPYIINTARGPLIEESELIIALQNGSVQGAGLDVFEEEPLSLDNPLRKMDQVILSSHNSNSSPSCWERVHINSINMLKEGLAL
tara:strand:+ start:4895 stop:5833 length:939 start_codon:yes stop_codon:yes gene_type:complete